MPTITYTDLKTKLRSLQLSSTQKFDTDCSFSLSDILANSNDLIGRTVQKKFPPKPRKANENDPLYIMLKEAGLLATTQTSKAANSHGNTGTSGTATSQQSK